jgi:predicted amidophosphoribosyltransferase
MIDKCSKCDAEFTTGDKFCRICGNNLQEELEKPVCPKCKKSFPYGTKFCDMDGFKLTTYDKAIPKCVKCGSVYSDETKFCPKDGHKVLPEEFWNKQPQKVSNAIYLLLFTIVLGVVNSIIADMTTELKTLSSARNLFVFLFTLFFQVFLIYKIGERKKWARTTFIVLFIISVPINILYSIGFSFKLNTLIGIIVVIGLIMQVIALILLLSKDSNEWFDLNEKTNS